MRAQPNVPVSIAARLAIVAVLAVAPSATTAALPAAAPAGDKILITDGSFVHDVGRLYLNITNWGLIGSHYSASAPYSGAPSARWPAADGIDHLWAAGLWVGGVTLDQRSVVTGQYETELRASADPEDTIYRLSWGAPQALRYPLPGWDDDGDGLEDEDPPNGRDDDGDLVVDEDGAGASDQHFRCEMDDSRVADIYPDHVPLNIAVVQQSLQWAADELADCVGFEYTIRNVGAATIDDLYVGMFSDFDINDPPGANEAADDQVGFTATAVEAYPGEWVDVAVAYAYEGVGATTSGYVGWLVGGHPTDPAGVGAPPVVGPRTYQRFSGQLPYDQGGDPTNDNERYESLSAVQSDYGSVDPDDYRNLISAGPFAALAVGESISVAFALVAGADLDAMLRNAGRARLAYEGEAFDRDLDPDNGAEFTVRWLGPDDLIVSVLDDEGGGETPPADLGPGLSAAPNPFNPTVEIAYELARSGPLRLVVVDARGREVCVLADGIAAAGAQRWRWDGRDAAGRTVASGVYVLRLETVERVVQRTVTLVK